MARLLGKLLLMIAGFLGLWLLVYQVDWVTLLDVQRRGNDFEDKLGELYWDMLSTTNDEIESGEAVDAVDSILVRICEANHVDRETIKLHVLEKDEINAFTLPGRYMVIFSGLILECESAEELAGVVAHELAHMEEGHIMRKLIREVGLATIISATTGAGNPQVIIQMVKLLTSTAYDRKLEEEADLTGVDYLVNAEIDPEPFAEFLFRLSEGEKLIPEQLMWISTHPGSEKRANYIIERIQDQDITHKPLIDSLGWNAVHLALD